MENTRNRVLVVGEIFVIRAADIAVDVLQLHEQERHAVDETDDIGSAVVQRPLDPELAHGKEVIALCIVEIEHAQRPGLHAAARVPVCHLHAVAQQVVFFAVGLKR